MKTTLGTQVFEQQSDGTWLHLPEESIEKADTNKKDGTLKAEYKDLPRYKLIPVYEDHFKQEFKKTLSELNKEVFKFLKQNILT